MLSLEERDCVFKQNKPSKEMRKNFVIKFFKILNIKNFYNIRFSKLLINNKIVC